MAVINIDDAYILNETGAQVDKVTGLYFKDENTSGAEKAFAQLNIGTAGSNRNLLDNPWWGSGEVVNQRSVTAKPSTNGSYTIDRWQLSSGANANQWAIGANGATFTIASSSIWYMQIIPNISSLFGKTLTASVMFGDGTIKSGTATLTSSASATFWGDTQSNVSLNTAGTFQITVRATQTIRAVKLELGSVSTLANDAPPEYGEELRKCMRYFVRIKGDPVGNGYIGSALNTAFINIPFQAALRTSSPTISVNGSFYVRVNNSSVLITSITAGSPFSIAGGANLRCALQSSVANVQVCSMYCNSANDYIDLSADL